MSHYVRKRIKGRWYTYEVQSYRDGAVVKKRYIRFVGAGDLRARKRHK